MTTMVPLSEDCIQLLLEYAAISGLPRDVESIADSVFTRLLDAALDGDYLVAGIEPTESYNDGVLEIAAAVSRITDFNAAFPVEIKLDEVAPHGNFEHYDWQYLVDCCSGDLLVKQVKDSGGALEQQALTDLYNALPPDLWGSIKAVELYKRQLKFMGGGAK